MSKFLPPWRSYEVPEQCKTCPYITSLEKTIDDQSASVAGDGIAALGVTGLTSELRGRKRRAQDCIGPVVIAKSNLVYCNTQQRPLSETGENADDRLDADIEQRLKAIKSPADLFPDDNPPQE